MLGALWIIALGAFSVACIEVWDRKTKAAHRLEQLRRLHQK